MPVRQTVTLDPKTAYVLSAYLWNLGNTANHVTTVVDMNDVFQEPQITHEPKVKEEHIRQLFKDGWLQRSKAAPMLMKIAQVGRSASYDALKRNGRFASNAYNAETVGEH